MNLDIVNIYLFVVAALVSVVPILIIFKMNIKKLKVDPQQFPQVQKHFFIGAAISKILPIILIIFGILKMPSGIDMNLLYVPWVIIVAVVIYGFYYISSQKKLGAERDVQIAINTLVTITRPHLFTIPIMAIVFLFLMTL